MAANCILPLSYIIKDCVSYVNLWFLLCYCSQVVSREVFCHEYGKIPRHTGQNPITEGDLEWILTKLL